MLHTTIDEFYIVQKRSFKKIISSLFGLAGIFWLVIYCLSWLQVATHDEVRTLRSGQSIIYFVLLTLWGVEYLRETKRLKRVIAEANASGVSPDAVPLSEIPEHQALFSVLRVTPTNVKSVIFPLINWSGFIVCAVLIFRQYFQAILQILQ